MNGSGVVWIDRVRIRPRVGRMSSYTALRGSYESLIGPESTRAIVGKVGS